MVLCVYGQPHVLMGSKSEGTKGAPVAGWLGLLASQLSTRSGNWDMAGERAEDHSRLKKGKLSGLQGR